MVIADFQPSFWCTVYQRMTSRKRNSYLLHKGDVSRLAESTPQSERMTHTNLAIGMEGVSGSMRCSHKPPRRLLQQNLVTRYHIQPVVALYSHLALGSL